MRVLPKTTLSKILLALLVTFFLLHFIILTLYIKSRSTLVSKHDVAATQYKLVDIILHASQAMPMDDLERSLSLLSNSVLKLHHLRITLSLTKAPKWPIHFNYLTPFSHIHHYLEDDQTVNTISYHLKSGYWLNYAESPSLTYYSLAFLLLVVELSILGLVGFYVWSVMRFTLPLKQFKASAERLGIDLHAPSIKTTGPVEVKETADAMNKMQLRIQNLINMRTRMLASISHDLRTPITRLKLQTQFLSDEEAATQINLDLDEMEKMITQILDFAKEDALQEKMVRLDLDAFLQTLFEEMSDLGYKVHYKGAALRLPVLGRKLALKRMFLNLITNALKYAGEVWIVSGVENNKIQKETSQRHPGNAAMLS